jgi:hypothetical protein
MLNARTLHATILIRRTQLERRLHSLCSTPQKQRPAAALTQVQTPVQLSTTSAHQRRCTVPADLENPVLLLLLLPRLLNNGTSSTWRRQPQDLPAGLAAGNRDHLYRCAW